MSRSDDDLLADLARHPGWAILEERVKEKHQAEADSLSRAILYQKGMIDQMEIERARGFWLGQRWVLRQVRHAFTAYRTQMEKEGTKT